jgi:hypothetical protein
MKKRPAIPPQRIVLYSLIGALLFVFVFAVHTKKTIEESRQQRKYLQHLGQKITTKIFHQKNNRDILLHFSKKDPLFLHKAFSSFSPLSKERALLQKRTQKNVLPEDALLIKRGAYLSSGENQFVFVETSMEIGSQYKETIERQTKPVEVNTTDLEKILSLIEDPHQQNSQRPHLIVSEARIERKKGILQEVWAVHFNIIRREYFE